MPEQEGPARAVYDHTEEEPRPAGRRRRQIADWGVGEELFDGMPGRRFERRGEEHRIPRGGADDGRRTIVIADAEVPPVEKPEALDEEFASREEALRAREEHDRVWAGDEPFADEAREQDESPLGDERDLADAFDPEVVARSAPDGIVREGRHTAREGIVRESRDTAREGIVPEGRDTAPEGIVRGGVEGRRTVKIGGRPAEFHSAPARRRPSRAVHERVGPRPDRIAAWAFALGLLLILIAIATANI
jgi:hypothetical protein